MANCHRSESSKESYHNAVPIIGTTRDSLSATHATHGGTRCSHESHVSHLAPALVVSIRSVGVLDVVGRLDVELGVVRVVHEELDLALKGRHVLTVHLIGERPEDTLPNEAGLTILEPQVVLVVWALRDHVEIEVRDVEPKRRHAYTRKKRPALEPTFRVDVVQGPIGVTLERSSDGETVRRVLLGEYTEGVDDIGHLSGHLREHGLLGIPEAAIHNSLFEAHGFIVVLTYDSTE